MQAISPSQRAALFDVAATRRIEQAAAAQLAPYALMQRAGAATARLALALAPHARCIWIACGPGNNGGDGLEAATQLHRLGLPVCVTWLGSPETAPKDALHAWQRAQVAGVLLSDQPPTHLGPMDLCIDAVLGIGLQARAVAPAIEGASSTPVQRVRQALQQSQAPVLCVDVPSGLLCDTGQYLPEWQPAVPPVSPRHTLSLLTLKPGLFTGMGRDAAGTVWWDDLGSTPGTEQAAAWLPGAPSKAPPPAHASHKGSYADVAVVGGEGLHRRGLGMGGAALLAASAALHAGAGRVLVNLLEDEPSYALALQPEWMLRRFEALELARLTVVCGCGGGQAITPLLPAVLAQAQRLVLDADALNAVAQDPALATLLAQRGARTPWTVLTPHPLEAARLLGCSTQEVQARRLQAAQQLAQRFSCTVVLKGSGSVITAPEHTPVINPTGNARLATAGTGDVLAGLLGARLALAASAFEAARRACWEHGQQADQWPTGHALTANLLARRLARL